MYAGSAYGDARSGYAGSMYGQPPGHSMGMPGIDHRGSSYSILPASSPSMMTGGLGMGMNSRQSSYSFANSPLQQHQQGNDTRHSSYSFASLPQGLPMNQYQSQDQIESQNQNTSRPVTSFLPEILTETAVDPISLGEAGITEAQLETSIRRICQGADLDQLTKKGVRKQLEEEFSVGLGARKEGINRIIEMVLAGEC
jgi:chitin synthase